MFDYTETLCLNSLFIKNVHLKANTHSEIIIRTYIFFLPLIFALSTIFLIFIHHTDINRKYYPFFFQLHSFAYIFQHHLLKLHFDRAYKIWPLVSSEQIKCWQLHFFFFFQQLHRTRPFNVQPAVSTSKTLTRSVFLSILINNVASRTF